MPENLAITVNGNTPATMPEMVVVNGSVIAEWPGRDDSACRMTLERNRPEAIDIKIEFSDRAATEGRWRCVLSQSTPSNDIDAIARCYKISECYFCPKYKNFVTAQAALGGNAVATTQR